jgi:2-dehydro-3-deoxygluconokinase
MGEVFETGESINGAKFFDGAKSFDEKKASRTKKSANSGKVLTFGELLLRICPDASGTWLRDSTLPFYVGGAELNVATALARWEVPTAYLTALPDNLLSRQLVGHLEENSLDTSRILWQGERVGLYYLHQGKDLKHAGVIYDRANSSFSTLKAGVINWDAVLEDVSWFHFSAICPALSEALVEVCEQALIAASKRGIEISLDLNYREKLWKYGKEPLAVMPWLAKYCTVIMGNIWAANKMLGIALDDFVNGGIVGSSEDAKAAYLTQAEHTSKEVMGMYPNCKAVANTFRFDEDSGLRYYATLYAEGQFQVSKEYRASEILDKVGSGDCFMAGLIFGYINQIDTKGILNFATAAAFSKLFIAGDSTTLGIDQINAEIEKYENT